MFEFFKNFESIEKAYFIIAVVATIFLVIQIILMLVSFDNDFDVDGEADADGVDSDGDSGVSLFTTKSLTAFFAVGGWAGLASYSSLNIAWASILIAFSSGILAAIIVWLLIKGMLKLQSEGNIDLQGTIGKTATVYVGIQPNLTGKGKVTITHQGKFMELDAMTKDREKLQVDTIVYVTEVNDDCLIVEKVNKEN